MRDFTPQEIVYLEELYGWLERFTRRAKSSTGVAVTTQGPLHDGLLRLLQASDGQWKGSAHFQGYAAKAIKASLIDRRRSQGIRQSSEASIRIEFVREEQASRVADTELIDHAISSLSDDDQQIVCHRLFVTQSHLGSATAMNVPMSRVRTAWKKFKEQLLKLQ